jgi:hypothetical protein
VGEQLLQGIVLSSPEGRGQISTKHAQYYPQGKHKRTKALACLKDMRRTGERAVVAWVM